MKYKLITICFILIFTYFNTGCIIKDAEYKKLVDCHTDFGFNLYSALLENNKGENIFISPPSIALALSMTYNGAKKETKESMKKVLEINGMNLEELNRYSQSLIKTLENSDPNVKLYIANSLWCKPDIIFKQDFIERCENNYLAEISNKFDKERINGWIKERTEGKIQNVIDNIPPLATVYLIDAIYFQGNWSEEFDKNRTFEQTFYLSDGTKKKHPLMSAKGEYKYFKGENFQATCLPYGEGRINMYIFLPDEGSSLKDFQANLNSQNWKRWIENFKIKEGIIEFPRFKCEYKVTLNDTLKDLGMEIAFDKLKANFSGMTDQQSFISNVIHNTFINVNEEGTEAAGITVVEVQSLSGNPFKGFFMKVNKPFFFAIRDDITGSIIFMGSIEEPFI